MKKRMGILLIIVLAACAAALAGCSATYYTVTYEAAGGSIAATSRQVTYDEEFILDVPVRDDATFLGWFGSADDNAERITDRFGKSLGKYALQNDSTVYAKWSYWDTDGLEYALSSDGGGYIVFASENFSSEVVKVPAEYNGLPVVRVGEYAFFENASVKRVVLPDTVVSIGAYAFDTCTELETVEGTKQIERVEERSFYKCSSLMKFAFGANVNYIGGEAFGGCSLLSAADFGAAASEVTMEPSAFSACTALSNLVLPSDMPVIPVSAFGSCTALQQVRIEGNVRQISDGAFAGCINMRSLYLGESVTALGANALSGCTYLSEISVSGDNKSFSASDNILYSKDGSILYRYAPYKEGESFTVPASVKRIGAGAFEGGEYLVSLTVNTTVTAIESGAFRGMKHITDIVLPFIGGSPLGNTWFSFVFGGEYSDITTNVPYTLKNVTVLSGNMVSERAFQFCNSLATIKFPETVTAIGACAFYGCASISELELPGAVRSIGELAFVACTRLRQVTFGGENDSFTSENGLLYDKDKTTLLLYPAGKTDEEFTLPTTVTAIADSAFYYASRLKRITLPEGLETIGNSAFFNCRGLESAALPSTVTKIGDQTFADCINLKTVRLSANLRSLGAQAFFDCVKLEKVEVKASEPPATAGALFLDTNDTFAIVFESDSVKAAYAASDWADYEAHFATEQ